MDGTKWKWRRKWKKLNESFNPLGLILSFPFLSFSPCVCVKSLQSGPTLWDRMDCSPPGSSVHGILQARILEWVAMPFSRIFLTQGLNSRLPASPAFQADTLPTEPPGRPEFEVPEGKSSGKVYQEVKGWDLNLKSLGLNIHLVIDIGVVIEATTLSKEK